MNRRAPIHGGWRSRGPRTRAVARGLRTTGSGRAGRSKGRLSASSLGGRGGTRGQHGLGRRLRSSSARERDVPQGRGAVEVTTAHVHCRKIQRVVLSEINDPGLSYRPVCTRFFNPTVLCLFVVIRRRRLATLTYRTL